MTSHLRSSMSRGRKATWWKGLPAGLLLLSLLHARADEPIGCDGFKWPLKQEAALLQANGKPVIAPSSFGTPDGKAYELKLVDLESAHLLQAPERTPKFTPSNAGVAQFEAPPRAGAVQVTVSAAVWVDLVQNGHLVKAAAFSGAQGCPGVRKSIRFNLAAAPFAVQISGTREMSLGLIAGPVSP